MMFKTPGCGSSVINTSKINDFQVLILTPFCVSFWRCFGNSNGGQCHQKFTSKNHQKNMSNMSPNKSQRGSQLGAKIVKNEVLDAPCFKGGSQVASRAPPGSILERLWHHLGTIFVSFPNICLVFFACTLYQHVANKNVQNYKESSKEN